MRSNDNTCQISERDDLHEISQTITKQPFNVLAHKRLKKTKPIFTQAKEGSSLRSSKEKLLTKDNQGMKLSEISEIDPKANLNRRFTTYQTHFSSHSREKNVSQKLRMNQTVSVKPTSLKQSESASVNQTKQSDSSFQIGRMAEESAKKASFSKMIEKQFNQGPLKQKHLMNWLNQILIEYCFEYQFQKGQLKALERFGLDQNNLLSRGMTLGQITRLYKMLFVYSMGFNNLMKEITGSKRSVMKSIWKVYAMLLEYCSEGNFDTIMGELQRDMIKNEQRLIKEIENRQILIDNNEEIMEERLHKYTKDNKDLTQRVKNLEEKNEILEKEFREMEMAYNMEVSLRLAYQYKINEIYSVHEKLNILHLNMYKELQEKTVQHKRMSKDCWDAKKSMNELKAHNEQLLGILSEFKTTVTLNDNLIVGLRMNERQLTQKLFSEMNVKRQEIVQLRQKEKKINQLQREVGSGNLIIEMMKSSSNSHLDEYKRLMMENSDLRRMNSSQLDKINEILGDIKYLNSKESTLKSELEYSAKVIKEYEVRVSENQAKIDNLTVQLQKKDIQFKTKCVELESQEKLANSISRNMKEIDILYQNIQEQNKMYKKYSQEMNKNYVQAHNKVMNMQLEIKALKEQKFEVELDLSRKIGQIISLKKKYQADNEQQQKIYEKLHKNWSGQDIAQAQLNDQLTAARNELETANIRISFLSEQFTDLTFEKSKIEAIYKDNLVLHEREKDAQKQLMIQMSKLTEQLEVSHRQIEVNIKTSQQQMAKLTKQKEAVEKKLRIKQAALKKKEGFVHPMLLQDALQTLKREIENHYTTKITLENEVNKECDKNSSLELQLQKKEVNFRQHVKELEKRVDKMREEMQGEREYFQGKSEQLNSMIYNLETKLNFKSMEIEMKQDNSNEAKFLELVKNKNEQIQQLLSELERIEDTYQQKCNNYENEIHIIHKEKESVITELKQSKKDLETKVTEIQRVYKEKLIEKQKQKEEIVQKMLEKKATANQISEESEEQERPVKSESKDKDKRNEFIKRLKFAQIYYKK